MDGGKRKRSGRKSGRLSLTQNGESSEENPSDGDAAFHIKSSQVTISQKASEGTSKQQGNKSSVRIVNSVEDKGKKQAAAKSPLKDYCPICQVPLLFIKIPGELHTAHCLIEPDVLPACPDGIACLSVNMFHYRDFNHNELAQWRCSADYVPPEIDYPVPPKSTKRRPSLSPLSLASRTKKTKTPENEKVDDPDPASDAVRKALFQEEQKPEIRNHKPTEAPIEIEIGSDVDSVMTEPFHCDPLEREVVKAEVKPLKCDVTLEFCADEAALMTATGVVGKQSACSVACLSPSNGEELQAVCTVSIRAPGRKPQDAASKSPVHVNLLMNESGWEAIQVDGSSSARVKEVDISLCKCARALTLKCHVADPKIAAKSSDVKIEHKYSAVLGELGLKKEKKEDESGEASDAHEKVDRLKNQNSQLTIKSFFASGQDDRNPEESTKAPVQTNGELPKKMSSNPARPKAPMFFLSGASSSRPPTPIVLGESSVSRVSNAKTLAPEAAKPRRAWGNSKTPVPQYKRIYGTPFVVDAFKWGTIEGVRAYFLSHFHSDHYIGLRKNFNQPIYCSRITANLIRLKFGVDPKFLHVLEIGEPRVLCNVEVEVFDANHCPGSLMFLFRLLDGTSILHVGDFRASTRMEELRSIRKVNTLYLDTTYCDPVYDFPSQADIVKEVVKTAQKHVEQNPKTLFCCGSYTIGKEKVFLTIAEALDCQFWTNKDKAKVLKCLGDDIINRRLVSDPAEAKLYVVYMKDINIQNLDTVLKDAGPSFTSLVAFEPTGWTTSKIGSPSTLKKTTKGRVTIYAVPYSEHSSFPELRRFVRFVQPKTIQVTVNLGKQKVYQKYFKQWLETSGGDQASLDGFLCK